jgi:hypothetical protein
MIDPETGEDQWNVLRLGTTRSPGVVKVTGPGLVIGWDVQNATGSAGAVTKRINAPAREFEAEFELTNEPDEYNINDFDRWAEFQALLESMVPDSKTTKALDVYHPDLARVRITAVTLRSIGLLQPDGRGGGKIKVQFIEHRPPKPVRTTASAKASAPKTAADKEIDQLTKDIGDKQAEWKNPNSPGVPITIGDSL